MIYGQRKNFYALKKVLLIQKKILWSKEIDLFKLKKTFVNQQNFLQFKQTFSLAMYQRNISLIQRNYFLIQRKKNNQDISSIKKKLSLTRHKFVWFKEILFESKKLFSGWRFPFFEIHLMWVVDKKL